MGVEGRLALHLVVVHHYWVTWSREGPLLSSWEHRQLVEIAVRPTVSSPPPSPPHCEWSPGVVTTVNTTTACHHVLDLDLWGVATGTVWDRPCGRSRGG